MSVTIGINGFGRMGRLALRAGFEHPRFKWGQINDIGMDAQTASHLLQFDSVHGAWNKTFSFSENRLSINTQNMPFSSTPCIDDTDWSNCDIVIEATGVHHKTPELLNAYFKQGVKKVVVAAPTKGALNMVYGVNQHLYQAQKHHLLSAASCTTNCLAPIVKIMHDNVGIKHGSMTTIHNITNTQSVVDKGHKDLRRARSCGQSLIPTSTGSAKAISDIFPDLKGKLNGHAVRVPLTNGSLTDFVFEAQRPVTVDEVNALFKNAAEQELKGILGYETRPLVSVDYVNDARSSIVDALSTMVINQTQVKIYAWYDNEWGYVNRLIDIAEMVAKDF